MGFTMEPVVIFGTKTWEISQILIRANINK